MEILDKVFKFFKKDIASKQEIRKSVFDTQIDSEYSYVDASSINPDERPYYKPDEYYTYYSYPGTEWARRVITSV